MLEPGQANLVDRGVGVVSSLVCCAIISGATLAAQAMRAAEVAVVAESDTFVAHLEGESLNAQNFGASGGLAVAAQGSPKGEMEALLRFDLEAVRTTFDDALGSEGWAIESIQFEFNVTRARNPVFNATAAGTICAYSFDPDTWEEGMGRTSFPDESGLTFDGFAAHRDAQGEVGPLGCVDFDGESLGKLVLPIELSNEIVSEIQTESVTTLRLAFMGTSGALVFNSREIGMENNRPVLRIVASERQAGDQPISISLRRLENSQLNLQWLATSDVPETLQATNDLTGGEWQDLAVTPVREDGVWNVVVEIDEEVTGQFFRLVATSPN